MTRSHANRLFVIPVVRERSKHSIVKKTRVAGVLQRASLCLLRDPIRPVRSVSVSGPMFVVQLMVDMPFPRNIRKRLRCAGRALSMYTYSRNLLVLLGKKHTTVTKYGNTYIFFKILCLQSYDFLL